MIEGNASPLLSLDMYMKNGSEHVYVYVKAVNVYVVGVADEISWVTVVIVGLFRVYVL